MKCSWTRSGRPWRSAVPVSGRPGRPCAKSLTAGLRDKLAGGETPNRRDTLALLLIDALRVCDRKEMLPEGTTLAAHLSRIRSEVLNLDANCQAPDMNREP